MKAKDLFEALNERFDKKFLSQYFRYLKEKNFYNQVLNNSSFIDLSLCNPNGRIRTIHLSLILTTIDATIGCITSWEDFLKYFTYEDIKLYFNDNSLIKEDYKHLRSTI